MAPPLPIGNLILSHFTHEDAPAGEPAGAFQILEKLVWFVGHFVKREVEKMSITSRWTTGLIVGLLATMLVTTAALADDVKIGFVNSAEIFASYKAFTDVQQRFDKEVEEWQTKTQGLKAEVDSLAAYIKGEISVLPPRLPFHALSEAKQQERQEEYKSKEAAYLEYVNTIFGPDGTAERRNAELTQPVLDKINSVIAEIAQEEGYTYVFDAVAGNIAYADTKYDLTDAVVEELNKEVE
jgi:outer membrane protein